MSSQIIKFFGSESDLKDLRKFLSDAGFKEDPRNIIHATDASGGILLPLCIAFVVPSIPEFSRRIKMYLQKFSKLMVTTVTPDEVKRTITGNISAKKTGEVIEISAGFEIKDVKRMRSPRKTDDNKSRRLRRRIK
jgi:hypothetical protein